MKPHKRKDSVHLNHGPRPAEMRMRTWRKMFRKEDLRAMPRGGIEEKGRRAGPLQSPIAYSSVSGSSQRPCSKGPFYNKVPFLEAPAPLCLGWDRMLYLILCGKFDHLYWSNTAQRLVKKVCRTEKLYRKHVNFKQCNPIQPQVSMRHPSQEDPNCWLEQGMII